MRRAINTIPKDEYNKLLREAMQRMSNRFIRLIDEEELKMRLADDKGNYERAEKYDFNARALRLMADMYFEYHKLNKETKE